VPLGAKTIIHISMVKRQFAALNFGYLMVCWQKLKKPRYKTCHSKTDTLQASQPWILNLTKAYAQEKE
jgi:hypothetical protein